jgi:hypothetical protein
VIQTGKDGGSEGGCGRRIAGIMKIVEVRVDVKEYYGVV